ncbi:hypothetical protein PSACC_02154 [Paramicrosporidium saccamoebae]|uniref:Uncharacterized protein n=1 Tax=Paramicrosporidium saccamoebae TaxID=1246581 RepID=A0A2H9TJS4_9FUNG|nr:hypothetical protein PSACC_02154 [Paramicrosporidium saccamoebae]
MCRASLRCKFDLRERLPVVLGAPARLLVTACTMTALREASRCTEDASVSGAPFVARRFELRRCRHDEPLPVQECIAALIGEDNPHHYGVVTDAEELKNTARRIAGVPLVFLERTFPLLEAPRDYQTKVWRGSRAGSKI